MYKYMCIHIYIYIQHIAVAMSMHVHGCGGHPWPASCVCSALHMLTFQICPIFDG